MRTLEEYINETEQIDEGLGDLIKGLFSSKGLKAASTSIQQSIENAIAKKYPNFMKAFNELQKSDAEDKELVENFNKIYEAIDGMKLSDNQKVFQKLCQLSIQLGRFKDEQKDKKDDANQDKNTTPLDKETHKAYFEDLTKKMQELHKQHEEICKKYDEAVNKGEVKEEDVLGKSDNSGETTQDLQVVDDVTKKSEGVAKATDGNHEAVVAAVKKFLGVSESLNEGKNSEEYRVMFSKKNDPKGEKLLALTILLDAWKGLAKQLNRNDKPEQLLPFIQSLFANTEFTTEFKK